MDSFDLDPYLTHSSLERRESDPQTASRSVCPFQHSSNPYAQHTDTLTDTQTTLHVTSAAIGRIYEMHAMWPTNQHTNSTEDLVRT